VEKIGRRRCSREFAAWIVDAVPRTRLGLRRPVPRTSCRVTCHLPLASLGQLQTDMREQVHLHQHHDSLHSDCSHDDVTKVPPRIVDCDAGSWRLSLP
jgi:hypothetical protein